jgi:hypothetical protein
MLEEDPDEMGFMNAKLLGKLTRELRSRLEANQNQLLITSHTYRTLGPNNIKSLTMLAGASTLTYAADIVFQSTGTEL